MSNYKPTNQQQNVINYVNGHARVLAVAGSGKTSTMVHRIINLISNHHVNPNKIYVLMFNAAARKDFTSKYKSETSLPAPSIQTFHSFSFKVLNLAIAKNFLPKLNFWIMEEEINIDNVIRNIIKRLEDSYEIVDKQVELEEAKQAISWWKNSLVSPDEAGHYFDEIFVKIYKMFEEIRLHENAITFDDFVPYVIKLVEKHPEVRQAIADKAEHIIVDEYQDVNEAQQKLIELLAGKKANVMAVGDDDQTIYEWRGAKPSFILTEFEKIFNNKPNRIFTLDETFRFGPIISQTAQNSIKFNENRHPKSLVSGNTFNPSEIHVTIKTEDLGDYNEDFSSEVIRLVIKENVKPKEIRVIGRLYAQFLTLEVNFLKKKIPYLVEGAEPFFKKPEVRMMLSYLEIIQNLHRKIDDELIKHLQYVINIPNRMINKTGFRLELEKGKDNNLTIHKTLQAIAELNSSNSEIHEKFIKLISSLERLNTYYTKTYLNYNPEIEDQEKFKMSSLLSDLMKEIELFDYWIKMYGDNERSDSKIKLVQGFLTAIKEDILFKEFISITDFINLIMNLDSTQGAAPDQIIYFSTVFKTKGLEFDYVFIPSCNDGMMPYTKFADSAAYNKKNETGGTSISLEGERRLFYVAITRGKKMVYIGADADDRNMPSRFLEESQWKETRGILYNLVNKLSFNDQWIETTKNIIMRNSILESLTYYLKKENLSPELDAVSGLFETNEPSFNYKFKYDDRENKKEDPKDSQGKSPWENVII